MTRQVLNSVENSFIKGLISQATALNFPENACVSTDNCVFSDIGTVYRRLGIDLEDLAQTRDIDRDNVAITDFLWKNAADDNSIALLVIQIGTLLYFYDAMSYANVSLGALVDTVDLMDFVPVGGGTPAISECQFTNGKGVLFVFHPQLDSFRVEYNPATLAITTTVIELKIRDFAGDDDGLVVNERPVLSMAGIPHKHWYNLRNQGWDEQDTNLTTWDAARSDLPSNADIMFLFKNASDVFDTTTVANKVFGNSPAPKGHYILNLYDQDRISVSGISGLTTTTAGFSRASTGTFYGGRVWYTGINARGYKGNLYFSPIIENLNQVGSCHQINDPTSEELPDILPSDGGVISLEEAGVIYKLFPVSSFLIACGSNGVWAISGSQGLGFAANDYSIQKIADVPSISASSFVNVQGYPLWWNYDGIYTIAPTQSGGLEVKSITDSSIRSFYREIPEVAKLYARGAFDNIYKVVRWVYRDGDVDGVTSLYNFNRALNLNMNTGAFYPWTIADTDPRVNGIVFLNSVGTSVTILNVVDGTGNQIVDADGNEVVVYQEAGVTTARFLYIITYGTSPDQSLSFALDRGTSYYDWDSLEDIGPVDYSSSFTSGYKVHADGSRIFQTDYMNIYADNTNPGEFFIRSCWDYATSGDTGRWSTNQKLEFSNTNYRYRSKRIRIPGRGKALQFQVTSSPGQPFDIVGWSLFESANRTP